MYSESTTAAFREDLKIAERLCCLHHAETVFLAGNWQINGIITRHLQEHAGVGAALVGLSRGVQEARTKAETGSHMPFVANVMARDLERSFMSAVHLNVSQKSEVVAGSELTEMCPQNSGKIF